jgi:Family of unknown function (DUF5670)
MVNFCHTQKGEQHFGNGIGETYGSGRESWSPITESGNSYRSQDLSQPIEITEKKNMLWTIAIVLIVLWALGLLTHVAGGLIHLLLIVAVIMIVLNLVQRGRRAG